MNHTLARICESKIVAILRSESGDQLAGVAEALAEGGVDIIEVTFTVPNALAVIADVRKRLGSSIVLGAGSVLDSETARSAILAGAEFLVSPAVRVDCMAIAKRYAIPVMPGAYTPTEILAAWEAGADVVKLFPANIGGPGYLKTIRGPLPQIPIMPTGGVNKETIGSFLSAGAVAVGMGGSLVSQQQIEAGDFAGIRQTACEYVELVKQHKSPQL